jgi:hypothetical protein
VADRVDGAACVDDHRDELVAVEQRHALLADAAGPPHDQPAVGCGEHREQTTGGARAIGIDELVDDKVREIATNIEELTGSMGDKSLQPDKEAPAGLAERSTLSLVNRPKPA